MSNERKVHLAELGPFGQYDSWCQVVSDAVHMTLQPENVTCENCLRGIRKGTGFADVTASIYESFAFRQAFGIGDVQRLQALWAASVYFRQRIEEGGHLRRFDARYVAYRNEGTIPESEMLEPLPEGYDVVRHDVWTMVVDELEPGLVEVRLPAPDGGRWQRGFDAQDPQPFLAADGEWYGESIGHYFEDEDEYGYKALIYVVAVGDPPDDLPDGFRQLTAEEYSASPSH